MGCQPVTEGSRCMMRMSVWPSARLLLEPTYHCGSNYTTAAEVPDAEWVKELLPLLDDKPFRVVSQLGLLESDNYLAMKDSLLQHYTLRQEISLNGSTPRSLVSSIRTSCKCWLTKHTQPGPCNRVKTVHNNNGSSRKARQQSHPWVWTRSTCSVLWYVSLVQYHTDHTKQYLQLMPIKTSRMTLTVLV